MRVCVSGKSRLTKNSRFIHAKSVSDDVSYLMPTSILMQLKTSLMTIPWKRKRRVRRGVERVGGRWRRGREMEEKRRREKENGEVCVF